jgi:hypothetical protein
MRSSKRNAANKGAIKEKKEEKQREKCETQQTRCSVNSRTSRLTIL